MSEDHLHTLRHSTAHVLASAIQQLYPNVKLGVGPVIENGFFYDVVIPDHMLVEEDLKAIQQAMQKIVNKAIDFRREEMSLDEAVTFFAERGQTFKVELLKDLKERGTTKISEEERQDVGASVDTASIYYTGDFVDLCRGPHVANSKEIGAFKLTKLAGAYWRGKAENEQMQRIYGVAFETQEDLDAYLKMMEEAKKRDHRKLGQELDLFAFSDLVGPGLPLFTPKGTTIRKLLEDFVWSLMKPYGYERVDIPHMAKSDLYKTSGHWDKFSDDIFHVSSKKTDETFVMKPMNCPHHTQIFASRPRSYRDLPLRYSEVTKVYRDENTGQLQGLSRVRSITQDDAHVFCRPDQVEGECQAIYEIIKAFYGKFGMPLEARLSLSDPSESEKYLGGRETWDVAEATLRKLLLGFGLQYEEALGEAAFYGPKIDFIARDAIGRKWQLATIQLDFVQPERFALEYVDSDGEKKRPVMIHRAISGSLERFMGVLIEHFGGAFPLWLAPVQIVLASVGEGHVEYVKALERELFNEGVRVEADTSSDTIGAKVRNAAKQKVPWTIVVGDKEMAGGDFQVNVFGSEEKLSLSKTELLERVRTA
ncbi:MAG: Threonine-tRNA ligase [Candidatus Giovannonibacteria bacterium GW2011_GWA2_53_7]|uniref:Threonine--tRNA ligase n=1 Tax=Candidatus Giovannonibacteria bacterium GW2011_GWA2_53_7 TaxID=1618650 RepID=A0A0G1XWK2_9BACT|nr:MAG: Threonine-tRNA ligase [Candidatus Giovannonibacteria bacterium GW2011_GWA2_53_7]